MDYFENLSLTLRLANRKSLEYGDGHASVTQIVREEDKNGTL